MKTYLRIFSFAKPVAKYAIPYFLFSIIATVFSVLNFTLLKPLFDMIIGKVDVAVLEKPAFSLSIDYFIDLFNFYLGNIVVENGPLDALKFVCLVMIVSVLLSNVFNYISIRILEDLRVNTIQNIRNEIYFKLANLNIGFFSKNKRGDIVSRVSTDAYEVESSIADSFKAILKEPMAASTFFIAMLIISVKLTLFTFLVIPIAGGVIAYIIKLLKKDAENSQESLGRLISIIDETLDGVRIIKAFNAIDYVQNKFLKENEYYSNKTRALAYKRELTSPISEFFGVITVASIAFYAGSLIISNESGLDASQFLVYIALFSQVLRPIKSMTSAISRIQRGLVAARRTFELLDAENEIVDNPNAKTIQSFDTSIKFEKVGFAYETAKVLDGIDFTLEKGKTIALVGQSGGGKSTIADLIPRFYDIQEGKILIDGKDIRDISLDSLREQMGVVTQESVLFNDTIFNNIAFAAPDASLEDVIQAAKVANAHEFIMQMENGYDTMVGDRGMKLSGGQRQRISIARAIFKNPPILILDEATSALDTESEKLVQSALENLMKSRTSLVIAHRLSTIQNADEILVLDGGKIIERGLHSELILKDNGTYKKLTELQSVDK
ncbi:ABC transporter ATP-binding protein [Flammeovirgaceae bacterium SG7u.111]|nr:ABC transporter ATP-binding protein [Flammeovirgaceae bacterium SG7u.132]WPO36381.1 ABC transporter ATP-binding protein [Flammeovirgaceae bacterium SG7u.111]